MAKQQEWQNTWERVRHAHSLIRLSQSDWRRHFPWPNALKWEAQMKIKLGEKYYAIDCELLILVPLVSERPRKAKYKWALSWSLGSRSSNHGMEISSKCSKISAALPLLQGRFVTGDNSVTSTKVLHTSQKINWKASTTSPDTGHQRSVRLAWQPVERGLHSTWAAQTTSVKYASHVKVGYCKYSCGMTEWITSGLSW